MNLERNWNSYSRSSNDNFSVDQLLVKGGVLALLVGGSHQGVALVLEPLADAELIFGGTQQTGLLLGMLTTLISHQQPKTIIEFNFAAINLRRTEPGEPCPVDWQMRLAYEHW